MSDDIAPTKGASKIKQHFVKHKPAYIAVGCSIGTGIVASAATVLLTANNQSVATAVKQFNFFSNPVTEITNNVIQAKMHPGFKIRCVETGHDYASMREAAKMLDISLDRLRRHLNGQASDVDGKTFANLGVNLNGIV